MASSINGNDLILNGSCQIFTITPGNIQYSDNLVNYTTYLLSEPAFYVVNCSPEEAQEIVARAFDAITQDMKPVNFSASLIPTIASITSCFLLSWLLFIVIVCLDRASPLTHKVLVTYVCIYFSVLFGSLQNHTKDRYEFGYETIMDWTTTYFESGRVAGFFICFTLLFVTQTYTLVNLYSKPILRTTVFVVSTLFAIPGHILWIMAAAQHRVLKDENGYITRYVLGWLVVEMFLQVFFVVGVAWSFRGTVKLALDKRNWGIIAIILLTSSSSFSLNVLTLILHWVWLWAMPFAIILRVLGCLFFWKLKTSVDTLDRELLQKGTMGKPVYESKQAMNYHKHLSGDGIGHGTTTPLATNSIVRIWNWFTGPHTPSLYAMPIQEIVTHTYHSRGSLSDVSVMDTNNNNSPGAAPARNDEEDSQSHGTEHTRPDSMPGLGPGVPQTQDGRNIVVHPVVRRHINFKLPDETPVPEINFDEVQTEITLEESLADESSTRGTNPTPESRMDTRPGPSAEEVNPPPFVPHSGFRSGDYWDEKRNRPM